MSKQRLAAVEALFQAAVELPPESREHFLAEHCRDDLELRKLVTQLLAQDDIGLGSFLETPILPPSFRPRPPPGTAFCQSDPPFLRLANSLRDAIASSVCSAGEE